MSRFRRLKVRLSESQVTLLSVCSVISLVCQFGSFTDDFLLVHDQWCIMLFILTDNRNYKKKIDVGFVIDIVDMQRQS
jgi:hypothetical protein